jgi:uncharacterized protein involved in response to NO
VWYGVYAGWLALDPVLPVYAWHGHEMVFGFAPAVIVGFLLTAVRNWTGLPTPSGAALAGLFAIWAAARVLLLSGPSALAVAVDLAFLPLAALSLAIPLWRSGNWRNAFVVPLLLSIGALSLAHHGAYGGWMDPFWASRAPIVALDLVALLMAVIGGRVIPVFSANAVPGLVPHRWRFVEAAALGLLGCIIVIDATGLARHMPMDLLRGLFLTAAMVHLLRLAGWQPWATRHNPLLLAMPLAYLWLPVHLLLRGMLDSADGQMAALAVHAISVGAMAGLMLAMMTRSALGHTGRPLTAGPAELVMFAAIHLAASARVAGPLVWPGAYLGWIGLSTLLWVVAFAAFAGRYTPILMRPRVDA